MRPGYQSFAYWMRRPTGAAESALIPFYRDVVGLPLMRDYGIATLFWAGEDLVFEIKVDDHPGSEPQDPATAPLSPIFRSHDLDATKDRLTAAGYPVVGEESGTWSRTVWILGADRLLLGFQERSERSPLAADAEALRRWRAGVGGLPGVDGSLPADLHYLSRARRRVADVEAVAAYYRDVLGLDEAGREDGSVLLDLGDTVLLELAPGGVAGDVPADRARLADGFILRVHGWDEFVAGLDAAGTRWCGEQVHYDTGTKLAYAADVEGNPVGIEDRTLWGDFPEDLEADRRWRALGHPGAARS